MYNTMFTSDRQKNSVYVHCTHANAHIKTTATTQQHTYVCKSFDDHIITIRNGLMHAWCVCVLVPISHTLTKYVPPVYQTIGRNIYTHTYRFFISRSPSSSLDKNLSKNIFFPLTCSQFMFWKLFLNIRFDFKSANTWTERTTCYILWICIRDGPSQVQCDIKVILQNSHSSNSLHKWLAIASNTCLEKLLFQLKRTPMAPARK